MAPPIPLPRAEGSTHMLTSVKWLSVRKTAPSPKSDPGALSATTIQFRSEVAPLRAQSCHCLSVRSLASAKVVAKAWGSERRARRRRSRSCSHSSARTRRTVNVAPPRGGGRSSTFKVFFFGKGVRSVGGLSGKEFQEPLASDPARDESILSVLHKILGPIQAASVVQVPLPWDRALRVDLESAGPVVRPPLGSRIFTPPPHLGKLRSKGPGKGRFQAGGYFPTLEGRQRLGELHLGAQPVLPQSKIRTHVEGGGLALEVQVSLVPSSARKTPDRKWWCTPGTVDARCPPTTRRL